MIKDIIAQKKKHDETCRQKRQPLDTMEAYIYTYFNNKYGLKTLVIENIVALINGMKMF